MSIRVFVSLSLFCLILAPPCSGRGWFAAVPPRDNLKAAYCYVDPVNGPVKYLPPVILLHGMLDSRLTWHALAPKIAKYTGRRVYYIDARNHGDTAWSEQFNFDILADDLLNFMDRKGITRAVLIGHSMGGKTALTLALRRPDRVDKLMVEDASPVNLNHDAVLPLAQTIGVLREAIATVPDGADEITARQIVAQVMSSKLPPDLMPASEEYPELSLMQLPIKRGEDGKHVWKTNLDLLQKVVVTPGHLDQQLYGRFDKDTLFLYGTKSFFNVENDAECISKLFPRAHLKAVPGVGHLIHHQQPQLFAQEAINFINSSPSLRRGMSRRKY